MLGFLRWPTTLSIDVFSTYCACLLTRPSVTWRCSTCLLEGVEKCQKSCLFFFYFWTFEHCRRLIWSCFSLCWQRSWRFCRKLGKCKGRKSACGGEADGCSFPPATVDQRMDGVSENNSPWFPLGLLSIVVCHRYPIQQLVGIYQSSPILLPIYVHSTHTVSSPCLGLHVLWPKACSGGLG